MQLSFNDNEYEVIFITDTKKEGIGLELWQYIKANLREKVMETIYSEDIKSFVFCHYENRFPLKLVEIFIKESRRQLSPVELKYNIFDKSKYEITHELIKDHKRICLKLSSKLNTNIDDVQETLLEISYDKAEKIYVLSSYRDQLPFYLVEIFIEEALEKLPEI